MSTNIVGQTYDLFVTSVDKLGPLLKIWGQIDRQTSIYIEKILLDMLPVFDKQIVGQNTSGNLQVGMMCCARYKDGIYYRAQIRNLSHPGYVEVRFIDYGNVEVIEVGNIRLFDDTTLKLSTIPPQASEFVLSCVLGGNGDWDVASLGYVHQEVGYSELKAVVVHVVSNVRIIKVYYQDEDLSMFLVRKGLGFAVQLEMQEMVIRNILAPKTGYRVQKPELLTYKNVQLPHESEHMVYISYVEDGPYLFSVQLQSMEQTLEKLMADINHLALHPLKEPPVPGHPCLARCLEDGTICRAVVLTVVGDKVKTYYVDFGNTDVLPLSYIFEIPPTFILPKAMSIRFTLANLKTLNVTKEMKIAFKEFVTNKLLKLKVKLEDSPLVQYCGLYENDINIADILYDKPREYQTLTLNKGQKSNVIVSYIEGCKKFFVQLKECTDALNTLMMALAATSENACPLDKDDLQIGRACCAFYSGDNQWYRGKILVVNGDSIKIKYVDYGNEETVTASSLKKLDSQFIDVIPAQAIECCLYGYQNMSFNSEIENVFESLTLECEFSMKVKSKQNDTILVDLFDASCNNVAALLIEKLAAQKMQMTSLPSQQIATALMNDSRTSDNDEKIGWRNTKNQGDGKSWRNEGGNKQEEKKSWRNNEEKKGTGSWRSGNISSPVEDKANRSSKDITNNHLSNKDKSKVSKKKREKNNWNEDNRIDSWDNKSARRQQDSNRPRSRGDNWGDDPNRKPYKTDDRPRSRGDNWGDDNNKKPYKERRQMSKDDANKKGFKRDNSWGSDDGQRQRSGSNGSGSWGEKRPVERFQKRNDSFDSQASGGRGFGSNRDNRGKSFGGKKDFSSAKAATEPVSTEPLAELTEAFKYQEIVLETSENVAISWFYDPQKFYVQNLRQQKEFRDMMVLIQDGYKKKKPVNVFIPNGASVIAEFTEDSILYRASVLEVRGNKYKVQYVDFGNVGLVDSNKIYQIETRFMQLPIQSLRCGLNDIKPTEESWPVSEIIDNLFNKDSFTCVFQNYIDDTYIIQLFHNETNIRAHLIENGIALDSAIVEMDPDPVDVNLLLGQTLRVHVSHVDALEKFHVQLDQTKLVQIDSIINKTTPQSLRSEYILPQTNCLVKSEGKYYRAVVFDVQNDVVLADCPDFGGRVEVGCGDVYVLPSELCVFWYQSFECGLHNLINDSCRLISDEDFQREYNDKEVIVYVDNIENGRLLVTLYSEDGKKLELFTPDEDAYPTVEKLCPLSIFQSNLNVFVTHVNNANSLYIQLVKDANRIAELLEKLFEFYETNTEKVKNIEKTPTVLCSAKAGDGNWYRARIEAVTDENVKVILIDYGKSEIVNNENVKELNEMFFTPNELALNVGLGLVQELPELKNTLTELTRHKELKASIYYGESGWIVELLDGEDCINKVLVDSGLGEYPIVGIVEEKVLETIPEDEPEKRAQIIISHVDSPAEFYVQLVSTRKDIEKLQADLKSQIETLPQLEGVDIGSLCAAKYLLDETWYRAEVLDADSDITTVRFVDFGNTDVIDNRANYIKQLPVELLSIDKYARKCSLNVKPIKGDEWSPEACEIFENASSVETLYSEIVYQDEKNKTFIELFDGEGRNIGDVMIEVGIGETIMRDAEDDIANNTGFVSHLNNISEFWIQLESSVADLEMIAERLSEVDSFPDLQDLSPGILCVALYPDDDMWYRARILSNTVAGVEVLFIDYGNSSIALKLKVLPEDLAHMGALAQKCCLNKPPQITDWAERSTTKFHEISGDGATVFTVRKLARGETHAVELFIDGVNIVDLLVENRPVPVGAFKTVKGFVDDVVSAEEFTFVEYSDSDSLSFKCRLEVPIEGFVEMNKGKAEEYEAEYLTEEEPRTLRLFRNGINIVDELIRSKTECSNDTVETTSEILETPEVLESSKTQETFEISENESVAIENTLPVETISEISKTVETTEILESTEIPEVLESSETQETFEISENQSVPVETIPEISKTTEVLESSKNEYATNKNTLIAEKITENSVETPQIIVTLETEENFNEESTETSERVEEPEVILPETKKTSENNEREIETTKNVENEDISNVKVENNVQENNSIGESEVRRSTDEALDSSHADRHDHSSLEATNDEITEMLDINTPSPDSSESGAVSKRLMFSESSNDADTKAGYVTDEDITDYMEFYNENVGQSLDKIITIDDLVLNSGAEVTVHTDEYEITIEARDQHVENSLTPDNVIDVKIVLKKEDEMFDTEVFNSEKNHLETIPEVVDINFGNIDDDTEIICLRQDFNNETRNIVPKIVAADTENVEITNIEREISSIYPEIDSDENKVSKDATKSPERDLIIPYSYDCMTDTEFDSINPHIIEIATGKHKCSEFVSKSTKISFDNKIVPGSITRGIGNLDTIADEENDTNRKEKNASAEETKMGDFNFEAITNDFDSKRTFSNDYSLRNLNNVRSNTVLNFQVDSELLIQPDLVSSETNTIEDVESFHTARDIGVELNENRSELTFYSATSNDGSDSNLVDDERDSNEVENLNNYLETDRD